jgi:hypothetical protein
MTPRSRRLVAPLALGAVTLCATAYVGLVDPNDPGHYPLCPTKALTGLDCPGCGGLRAVHALVTGDLVGALDHNAYVVLVVVPVAVAAWIAWLVRSWRGPAAPETPAPVPAQYAAVGSSAQHAEGASSADPAVAAPDPVPEPVSTTGWADPRLMWALLAIALVFTVVRNVDAVPALQWLGSGAGTS